MEDFNLHLTGDFHAVADANNLCAAAVDTSILLDNPLKIDAKRVRGGASSTSTTGAAADPHRPRW
jgi:formyltetrahydrofolate synthetase